MNTTANRTWLFPEIPVVQRNGDGGGWRWAARPINRGPGPRASQRGSGVQLSLEASPAAGLSRALSHGPQPGGSPAPKLLQPEALSQARPRGPLRPPQGPPTVRIQGGASGGPHLTSALRNRSPTSRSLSGGHSPRHQLPAASLPATAPCSQPWEP